MRPAEPKAEFDFKFMDRTLSHVTDEAKKLGCGESFHVETLAGKSRPAPCATHALEMKALSSAAYSSESAPVPSSPWLGDERSSLPRGDERSSLPRAHVAIRSNPHADFEASEFRQALHLPSRTAHPVRAQNAATPKQSFKRAHPYSVSASAKFTRPARPSEDFAASQFVRTLRGEDEASIADDSFVPRARPTEPRAPAASVVAEVPRQAKQAGAMSQPWPTMGMARSPRAMA
eukprot:CAMPEP_0113662434 /NCGR_PEP_ID=MMETSP0038_2-20120614/571_1 /TAXON_ID=2898 /ORGANISM="Cryptomonas paramecium" /LENGTH=232 /DNA_ID=CAMNT_0000577323 /DNA_START=168 /DNA_END=862 /DNA_ORIENTATION=- /assembly_acc=CAM_ASM_000170